MVAFGPCPLLNVDNRANCIADAIPLIVQLTKLSGQAEMDNKSSTTLLQNCRPNCQYITDILDPFVTMAYGSDLLY
jgi:hypothetical protein